MTRSRMGAMGVADALPQSLSPTDQVKAAISAAGSGSTRSSRGKIFSFDRVGPREAAVAPLLGIYLGFAVARLHERFPALQVPMLLWGMMAVMLFTLFLAVPSTGWRQAWRASPQLRMVGLLTALAVITVPLGIWITGAYHYFFERFTVAVAVYVACIFLLRDIKVFRRVMALFVLLTTVVAVRNLVGYFTHDLTDTFMTAEDKAIYQTTGEASAEAMRQTVGSLDPNDIAAVMATTLPLALWLAVGNFRRRMLWTPCALALVVAIIPTASRGGLLGLAAALIVLVLAGAKGWRRVLLILTLVAGAAAFMALAGSQMDRMDSLGSGDYNYTTSEGRIAIWKRGILWMIRRPWGYGLNNFPVYFSWLNGPERAAHNSLIQYGVELGVLGLAAYLFIGGTLVKSLLAMRRNAIRARPANNETIALTGHVLAMLAACWTTGFFLSNAYNPLTYMAIGIGSAVVLSGVGKPDVALPGRPDQPTGAGVHRRRRFRAFDPACRSRSAPWRGPPVALRLDRVPDAMGAGEGACQSQHGGVTPSPGLRGARRGTRAVDKAIRCEEVVVPQGTVPDVLVHTGRSSGVLPSCDALVDRRHA